VASRYEVELDLRSVAELSGWPRDAYMLAAGFKAHVLVAIFEAQELVTSKFLVEVVGVSRCVYAGWHETRGCRLTGVWVLVTLRYVAKLFDCQIRGICRASFGAHC